MQLRRDNFNFTPRHSLSQTGTGHNMGLCCRFVLRLSTGLCSVCSESACVCKISQFKTPLWMIWMALVSDAMVSGESNSTMVTPRTCPSAGAVLGASSEQPPLAKTRLSFILLSGTMSSALKLIFLVPGQLCDGQSLNYLFLQLHLLTHGPVFSFLPVHHSTGPQDSWARGLRAKQSAEMGFLRPIFPV